MQLVESVILALQKGSFPPPCGPESLCTLLDEESLIKYCNKRVGNSSLPEAGLPFQYFVLDGSTIVGLLEQPLGSCNGMYAE